MNNARITFDLVNQFFDRPAVKRSVDYAKRKNLSKAGSFVRRRARSSIRPAGKRRIARKRKGNYRSRRDPTISRPGQPPRLHTRTSRNIRTILFAWDSQSESVIVGPVSFSTRGLNRNVPELLEHGGRGRIRAGKGRKKSVRYRPRPFMGPALKAETPNFPDIWKNSVRPR